MAEAELTCPICGQEAKSEPPAFPFCSLRCKAVDMGSWLDGSYEEQLLGGAEPGDEPPDL